MQQLTLELTLDWSSPVHEGADAPLAAPNAAGAGQKAAQTLLPDRPAAASSSSPVPATSPGPNPCPGLAAAPTRPTAPIALPDVSLATDAPPAAPLLAPQAHGEGVAAASEVADLANGHEANKRTIIAAPAWQHPQANRHIVLGQHALGYWLQRRKRRSVGMKIASQGLEVHAPVWVNLAEIERILQSKSGWIVRKLQEQAQLQHNQQLTRPQWQDGQYLPWRGGLLQLRLAGPATPTPADRLSPARRHKLIQAARLLDGAANNGGAAHFSQPEGAPAAVSGASTAATTLACHQLWLDLPLNSTECLIRDCTAGWMQMQAQAVFTERMAHYAPLLGVQWRALKLSQANTRWGSASSNGIIHLHWRLIQMPPEVLDYVVVHELAHLREMNHSARFWALVEQILPDYRQRQFQLKRSALPPW